MHISVWVVSSSSSARVMRNLEQNPAHDPQLVHGAFLCSVLCRWGVCALVNNMHIEVLQGPMLLATPVLRCCHAGLGHGGSPKLMA